MKQKYTVSFVSHLFRICFHPNAFYSNQMHLNQMQVQMQMRMNHVQIQVQLHPQQGNQMQVQVQMPHLHLHLYLHLHYAYTIVRLYCGACQCVVTFRTAFWSVWILFHDLLHFPYACILTVIVLHSPNDQLSEPHSSHFKRYTSNSMHPRHNWYYALLIRSVVCLSCYSSRLLIIKTNLNDQLLPDNGLRRSICKHIFTGFFNELVGVRMILCFLLKAWGQMHIVWKSMANVNLTLSFVRGNVAEPSYWPSLRHKDYYWPTLTMLTTFDTPGCQLFEGWRCKIGRHWPISVENRRGGQYHSKYWI